MSTTIADTTEVLEAIKALNATNKSTNASQVSSRTGLSRQRVIEAATSLRRQGLIKDVGKGNAYNWRVVPADRGTTVGTVSEEGGVNIDHDAFRDLAAKAWATHPNNPERERKAIVSVPASTTHREAAGLLFQLHNYLPSNYKAGWSRDDGNDIEIVGHDNAGWTLDGYVIPRLASGLIFAKEVVA